VATVMVVNVVVVVVLAFAIVVIDGNHGGSGGGSGVCDVTYLHLAFWHTRSSAFVSVCCQTFHPHSKIHHISLVV